MRYEQKLLEYPKILTTLSGYAETKAGQDACLSLEPTDARATLKSAFFELSEALEYIKDEATPRFGGIFNIKEALKRAALQASLDSKDFMKIHAHIEAAARLKKDLHRYPTTIDKTFEIEKYAEDLIVLVELKKELETVFDLRGNIKDDATAELKKLRQAINQTERHIKETLEKILNKETQRLTEKLFTIRYDRYVIPVKLSEKNNVRGTILDYSSSGETAFIEPESIQNLTAKKIRLKSEETQEIERILQTLSYAVDKESATLKENTRRFTHLDILFAKAKYGHKIEGTIPNLNNRIELIKARHPLLEKKSVVANTIEFDPGKKMMVITGSNTGGKTVTLKTIGLLTLMAQSGLMIPALPGSSVRLFKSVRADIGDEQSIEQSLSTFSSHMSRIVDIIKHYDDDQLILLDELGSGTDPKEGSSLAMSILNELSQKDSVVVATTHYPELKAYAYTEDFIMNASVEFDEKSLKPTYKLLLRTPGESHAFLISRRLGLKESIIENAKKQVITNRDEVSELIERLKDESKRLDTKLNEYENLNHTLKNEKQSLKKQKQDLQKQKEKLKETIMAEHAQEMNRLKSRAETLIKELDDMKTTSFKAHELAEKKYRAKQLTEGEEKQTSSTKDHSYQPGDRVYIIKYNRYGELAKKQADQKWLVNMGSLSSVFSEAEFEYVDREPKRETKPTKKAITPRKTTAQSLDLRGMRVLEAKESLDKYLDDCAISKQPFATIIHGFGTLALRKMVKDVLSQSPHVKRHRDGEGSEGGKGATIVYFE